MSGMLTLLGVLVAVLAVVLVGLARTASVVEEAVVDTSLVVVVVVLEKVTLEELVLLLVPV